VRVIAPLSIRGCYELNTDYLLTVLTNLFDYLRFNFKTQDFVMGLPIKAQIRTQKCNAVYRSYGNDKPRKK